MFENETYTYLNSLRRFGWKLGLNNIRRLLATQDNPHLKFPSVLIAGTNGKGTTVALLESIFRQAGYTTGMFTSPHLLTPEERIRINGEQVSASELEGLVERLRPAADELCSTYFEVFTAMAFSHFAAARVDIAFVEVGLGGRFDATNVLRPILSVITSIDYDHTEHLGKTIESIAREKGGIFKRDVPCVTHEQAPAVMATLASLAVSRDVELTRVSEFASIANVRKSEIGSTFDLNLEGCWYRNLQLGLAGTAQLQNATLALACASQIARLGYGISEEAYRRGLHAVKWPARQQKMQDSPKVVVDVAHNPASIKQLLDDLREIFEFERLVLVVGLLADKNYSAIAQSIAAAADSIFVLSPASSRALNPRLLQDELARHGVDSSLVRDIAREFESILAHAGKGDLVCVTGSHFHLAEIFNFYKTP